MQTIKRLRDDGIEELLDEHGNLIGLEVPMTMMDEENLRAMASGNTRVVDALGRPGCHAPGHRFAASGDPHAEARAQAYDQYDRALTEAWRRGKSKVFPQIGSKTLKVKDAREGAYAEYERRLTEAWWRAR